jgi:hypothetical protein
MKKNVFAFGIIAGLIISTIMVVSVGVCYAKGSFSGAEVVGYAGMLVAFSFIFVGVKNYRDKFNGGVISFGRALVVGLYITLIASLIYVVVWVIDYYVFVPDFMERYSDYMVKEAGKKGEDVEAAAEQASMYKEMYRNPLLVVLFTFAEIFPVGLLVSLVSAGILRKKDPDLSPPVNA